jgi:hypothetical protein
MCSVHKLEHECDLLPHLCACLHVCSFSHVILLRQTASSAIAVRAEPPSLLKKKKLNFIVFFFSEPAKIIETNMNVSHAIAAAAGTDLVMFCKAEGNPVPVITWFKVSRM